MLLESSVMTIQTVAHFSIKFHPHQCVTLVPDEQERGSGGVLHTQGHVDTQKYRYCKSLFKLFSACSSPRYRAGLAAKQISNIVHNNTRTFWNFSEEMFITHIFNYTFWCVWNKFSDCDDFCLDSGKFEADWPDVPPATFGDCWGWALSPPPLTQSHNALFRAIIATSVTMRRFYLTERLL